MAYAVKQEAQLLLYIQYFKDKVKCKAAAYKQCKAKTIQQCFFPWLNKPLWLFAHNKQSKVDNCHKQHKISYYTKNQSHSPHKKIAAKYRLYFVSYVVNFIINCRTLSTNKPQATGQRGTLHNRINRRNTTEAYNTEKIQGCIFNEKTEPGCKYLSSVFIHKST